MAKITSFSCGTNVENPEWAGWAALGELLSELEKLLGVLCGIITPFFVRLYGKIFCYKR